MGSTQRGQHTNGRLDDVAQCLHLAHLTDTCLEKSHLRLLVKKPYRERDTYLGVETLGRTRYRELRREQLVEPLLDHRLTIRARNTDNGYVELVTMALC